METVQPKLSCNTFAIIKGLIQLYILWIVIIGGLPHINIYNTQIFILKNLVKRNT